MATETDSNPALKRTLTLSSVVILGVAWVTPLIALATIGICTGQIHR